MRFFTSLFLLSLCSVASADDWAHWRGPTGNGVALNAQPPIEWSSSENVKWKASIPGRGSGSPIVWQDRVFVVSAVPTDSDASAEQESTSEEGRNNRESAERRQDQRQQGQGGRGGRQQGRRPRGGGGGELQTLDFVVFCFDRSNGDLLWQKTAVTAKPHAGTHPTNGFASASPCTDGEHVYASFGSRGLFCYTLDGELKWSRTDLEPMATRNGFGEGSSPTIAGDAILLPWDHEGQSILYALNKETGETIWETKRDEPTEWSTPLVVESKNGKQVVLNGQNCARGYDLETGDELWRCAGQTDRPIASAVWMNDLVIVGSGYRGSFMAAFRLDGRGDLKQSDAIAWSINQDTPDVTSPILSNGRIYFHKGKTGVISCVDAVTGETLFGPSRITGINSTYASPVAAGGYIFLTGQSGTTVVIKDSDQLEVIATNSVGEGVDATPAPVDNQLFIRGERHLFCIEASEN